MSGHERSALEEMALERDDLSDSRAASQSKYSAYKQHVKKMESTHSKLSYGLKMNTAINSSKFLDDSRSEEFEDEHGHRLPTMGDILPGQLLEKGKGITTFDRIRFKTFLKTKVNTHSNYPMKIKRTLKIANLLLRSPAIAIIDQKALDLELKSSEKVLKRLKAMMPDTSFLVIISSYRNILEYDIVYIMKKGHII